MIFCLKTEKQRKRIKDRPTWRFLIGPYRFGADRGRGPLDLIKTDGRDLPVPIRVLKRTWPSDLDVTDQDLGFTVPAAGVAPVT